MATRTTGAIALRPTGHMQGGYFFYSFNTGSELNRNHWTKLPVPADVIQRVNMLAAHSATGLSFTDDDDEDYSPEKDGNSVNEDNTSEELVTIDEDELQDLHDKAQEVALHVPAVVLENVPAIDLVVPAIDAVSKNGPENDITKSKWHTFLVSINSALKFGTVTFLFNQKMPTILANIKQINQLDRMRGFRVKTLHLGG